MNDSEKTLIRYRMDRSKEALSAARLMYEKSHYNDALNRIYYSYFYTVIALLATEGIHPGKHTVARFFLNKNWIKTGFRGSKFELAADMGAKNSFRSGTI